MTRLTWGLLVTLIAAWFLLQSGLYAKWVSYGQTPDEIYHVQLANAFHQAGAWRIGDSESTYFAGQVSRGAYLYYGLLGKLLSFRPDGWTDYRYLRVFNVGLGLVGLFACAGLFSVLLGRSLVSGLALFFLYSNLMFVFLTSGVSYDNWANAFSYLSLLSVSMILMRPVTSRNRLAWISLWFASTSLGALGKFTTLPLTFFESVLLLVHPQGFRAGIGYNAVQGFRRWAIFPGLICAGLAAQLYVPNVVDFGRPNPSCVQVLGRDICEKHDSTSKIEKDLKQVGASKKRVPLDAFVIAYFKRVSSMFWNIFSHICWGRVGIKQLWPEVILIGGAALFAITTPLRRRKNVGQEIDFPRHRTAYWGIIALLPLYGAVVILENYFSYVRNGIFGAGLQARYWYPVFPLFIIWVFRQWQAPLEGKTRFGYIYLTSNCKKWLFMIAVVAIAVFGNFVHFVTKGIALYR